MQIGSPPNPTGVGTSHTHVQAASSQAVETSRPSLRRALRPPLKRAFDHVGAALLLAFLAPVLGGIALLLLATKGGPVLEASSRIGRGGRSFHLLRFRIRSRD